MKSAKKILALFLAVSMSLIQFGSCSTEPNITEEQNNLLTDFVTDVPQESPQEDDENKGSIPLTEVEPVRQVPQDVSEYEAREDLEGDIDGAMDGTLTKTVTGLSPNTTYYFRVRAVDGSGTYADSPYSSTASAKTAIKIATPSLTCTAEAPSINDTPVSTQNIRATVQTVSYASSYTIELSSNSSFSSPQVRTVTSGSALFTGLTEGTTYYLRVKGTYSYEF